MDTPVLKTVRRLDSIRLDANDQTYFTKEGYLIDHPILTSCGIFEYINKDGSIRRELRLPEHVFDKKSLETYRGKPIIITHDAGVVNKDNVDREQIGTILSDGYADGNDVRAEIIIHNSDAMKDCGLKELSLGYNLDLIEEPGTWNGERYDAIQTNIVINHLALVATARAGEQARLNIDGSDEPELRGGKAMANSTNNEVLTPEELQQAIEAYKAARASARLDADDEPTEPETEEPVTDAKDEPAEEEEEPVEAEEITEDSAEEGKGPEDIAKLVRDRKDSETEPDNMDAAKEQLQRKDADIEMLLAAIEKLLSDLKKDSAEEKCDSSEDQSQSLNADSADELFRQRLSICRMGDKLNLDGLENKSISEGKIAIISKVLPDMRMDGKSQAYIDAAYDMAVAEANKRKDVDYQRKQMSNGRRADGVPSEGENKGSMAQAARQRMLEREGGNK